MRSSLLSITPSLDVASSHTTGTFAVELFGCRLSDDVVWLLPRGAESAQFCTASVNPTHAIDKRDGQRQTSMARLGRQDLGSDHGT
jgi:hypothetical protein